MDPLVDSVKTLASNPNEATVVAAIVTYIIGGFVKGLIEYGMKTTIPNGITTSVSMVIGLGLAKLAVMLFAPTMPTLLWVLITLAGLGTVSGVKSAFTANVKP